ncbi:hypothetical protein DP42_5343 [Burkholderia pseudomallei]|nr:hypothetical protein DP42_5343 [Burkholderia pseudomallei]
MRSLKKNESETSLFDIQSIKYNAPVDNLLHGLS